MKRIIKKALRKIFNPIASQLGYKENKIEVKENLLEDFFSLIKTMGFEPKNIIDVGANHGNWTRTSLKYFPGSNYILLEPQGWLQNHIADILNKFPKVKFFPVGAGKVKGIFKFTLLDRDDSSNFLLSETQASQLGYRQVDVEVVTLNDFLPSKLSQTPDLIKIDAEGFDLEVLEGANNFFGKTEIFIVEAGVGSKYVKNDIAAVVEFMKHKGYHLFEITDLNRPFDLKVLWLVELVFILDGGLLHSKVLTLGIETNF